MTFKGRTTEFISPLKHAPTASKINCCNLATRVLKDPTHRGWSGGKVIKLRHGVFGVEITTPTGEVCHLTTLDEARLPIRPLE
jgi:hypothetical protein